jgi:hypothetical protein
MRVRVYDKENGRYFKSEVYAIINTGWYEKYAVLVPSEDGSCLKLFDYIDKDKNPDGQYNVLVNVIVPDTPDSWISKQDKSLLNNIDPSDSKSEIIYSYHGCRQLYDNQSTIASLFEGNTVKTDDLNLPSITSKLEGWNYIETQDDVEELQSATYGFHDSVLKSAEYISGASVGENKSMCPVDYMRRLTLVVDSQLTDSVEFVFEGLIAFNLRPSGDNLDSIINSVSIIIKDETIFFIDADVDEETFDFEYTCAKAYSLRWRFLPTATSE